MDIKNIMRQAQEMQKKMQKMQEEIAEREYEGIAGGGMVKAVISGSGMVKKITIDSSLMKAEEKDILEDLVVAAVNSAKEKSDEGSAQSMKSVTAGIPLPPGFKF